MKKYFITGTDTGVGKTFISCAILEYFKQQGHTTIACKPIASGCELTPEGLRNEDALLLQQAMTEKLDYAQVNPIAFQPAIAPHIASAKQNQHCTAEILLDAIQTISDYQADVGLVEGAGGVLCPLNLKQSYLDFAKALAWPVVIVVGMRLGCLNHALLTEAVLKHNNMPIAGWVANQVDPQMDCLAENIETLHAMLSSKCLGIVPHMGSNDSFQAAKYLTI